MQKQKYVHVLGLLAAAVGLIALVLFASSDVAYAQLLRTPAGGGALQGNLQATREARQANIQATAEAMQGNAQATGEAVRGNVQATGEAVRGNVQASVTVVSADVRATADVRRTEIASTVQAVQGQARATADFQRTSVYATAQAVVTLYASDILDIQATANALRTQIPANIQELGAEELAAWIDSLAQNAVVSIDTDARQINITYTVTESLMNTSIDLALSGAGYDPLSVATDFIPEGMFVTAEGVTLDSGISGRLTALVAIGAADGQVTLSVVYATVNDQPIPDAFVAQLNAELAAIMLETLTGSVQYDYAVTDAFTTHEALVVSAFVPY